MPQIYQANSPSTGASRSEGDRDAALRFAETMSFLRDRPARREAAQLESKIQRLKVEEYEQGLADREAGQAVDSELMRIINDASSSDAQKKKSVMETLRMEGAENSALAGMINKSQLAQMFPEMPTPQELAEEKRKDRAITLDELEFKHKQSEDQWKRWLDFGDRAVEAWDKKFGVEAKQKGANLLKTEAEIRSINRKNEEPVTGIPPSPLGKEINEAISNGWITEKQAGEVYRKYRNLEPKAGTENRFDNVLDLARTIASSEELLPPAELRALQEMLKEEVDKLAKNSRMPTEKALPLAISFAQAISGIVAANQGTTSTLSGDKLIDEAIRF